LPRLTPTDFIDENPHALVVRGVEPQHPVEDVLCLLESTEPPETQAEPAQAAEEGTVVDEAPGQDVRVRSDPRLLP
jgi:hypothetical protein